ncbi:hypothetical protein MSG_02789 [Mycobacterium shigaense]|uniref:Uncharacterized protein n=1 Tax=Mycobacterium shigaense TaxID=722731 RepID=A0A1Z4EIY5_9MYCO|nr:hypothetical protein MSG_02789 [Mycobacterium shigaense]
MLSCIGSEGVGDTADRAQPACTVTILSAGYPAQIDGSAR